jgi:hypothetical protein
LGVATVGDDAARSISVATNCLSITPATTVPVIVDRLTGQVRAAQIFVAVLGASNFTYAEESGTQSDGWACSRACPLVSSRRRWS